MRRIFYIFLLISYSLQAQFQIHGVVKNDSTKKGLPFATIITDNQITTISDVDGKFVIQSEFPIKNLIVNYIGFETKKTEIDVNCSFVTIYVSEKVNNLNEVIISNENNAKKLIASVIASKSINNPQEKAKSFRFKSYNKLVVTAFADSISNTIDTIFSFDEKIKKIQKLDSSNYKFKKIIDKQHLFLAEKIAEFQFKKPLLKETLIATKMAGFKEPIYELLGFNLQSFSVYDNNYELFETKYKSPISKNAFREYRFKILDTTTIEDRNIVVVYFKNKKTKLGLEGLLYIDSENFGIAKAVMRIRGVLNITGIHDFSYLKNENLWFPSLKNFKITKGKSKEPTEILGGRIVFDTEESETGKKTASDFMYIQSEMNIYDLEYNLPLKIKKSSVAIEVSADASKKDESFWKQNRKDSLDIKSIKTYHVLDSIVKKEKIERKIRFGRKIINGFVPFNLFDLDLRQVLSYNNFEGFRVGLGGISSELFSRKYRIDGYYAYGLKDETIKYSIGLAARIGNFSNTWFGGSYTDDVREIASTTFTIDKRVFKLYDPRPINLSTFYNHKTWRGFIETKIVPKTESIWQLTHSEITPLFNYSFDYNDKLYQKFTMTTASFSMQWNPFSYFMQTPNGKVEFEKKYPKFTFQFTKSITDFLDNDFDFGKIDARVDFEKKYLNGQKSSILIQAGYAFGAIPITHLYNTSPNNLTKDKILERITIAGKNSFETMYFNEFFSSKYVMLQLKHGLKRVELFKKIKPSFILVTRMAWGSMENPERHVGISYKTLDNGFFESGFELNQIFKGFGLTTFYRYGPNQLSNFEDNLAIKLSFIFDFGF